MQRLQHYRQGVALRRIARLDLGQLLLDDFQQSQLVELLCFAGYRLRNRQCGCVWQHLRRQQYRLAVELHCAVAGRHLHALAETGPGIAHRLYRNGTGDCRLRGFCTGCGATYGCRQLDHRRSPAWNMSIRW